MNDEQKNRLIAASAESEEKGYLDKLGSGKDSADNEYYDLPPQVRSRTRIWSVISIVSAILSVLLCHFYYAGMILSAVSVGSAVVSRRTLGFFDRISIFGIMIGIMGLVFSVFMLICKSIGLF